jgi:hypothetical protein
MVDISDAPVGVVIAVRWWTLRENVRYTVARIREQRASGGQFESLYTEDLRALLATRGAR